ncbi:MAG: hypothetical protein KC910_00610 [Candidatus Eremiobacteraeota bacterium]|nr:hypothetical protein [Candidatus Eremiobacteraeota bacterium]
MAITYLLERRRRLLNSKLDENLMAGVGVVGLLILVVAMACDPVPWKWGILILCLSLGCEACAFSYAIWQIWRYGSIWAELQAGRGVEELAATPASLKKMVDETARYTVLRALKVVGIPILGIVLITLLSEPQAGLAALGFFALLGISLAYTVQAWSSWSALAWYWSIFGIPIAYEFLVGCMGFTVGLSAVTEIEPLFWVTIPIALAGMVLIPRCLTLLGLTHRDEVRARVVGLSFRDRLPISKRLWDINPVLARLLAPYGRPRMRVGLIMGMVGFSMLGLELAHDIAFAPNFVLLSDLPDPEPGLKAILTGLLIVFAGAAFLTYFQVHKEQRSGSLELVQLANIGARQLVDGWVAWGSLGPLLLLASSLPGVAYGAWVTGCQGRAAVLLAIAPVLTLAGAYLGAAAVRPRSCRLAFATVGIGIAMFVVLGGARPALIAPSSMALLFVYASGALFFVRQTTLRAYS